MNTVEVKTQAELDKALKNRKPDDLIVCLGGTPYKPLVVTGSSRVEAWGSSRVEARGSSRVVARESSSVEARESSRVEAWGSSSVVARGSSRVEAWESSRVEARGSSRVEARGSSRVVAWGSSRVEAWESSRVEASKYVAVHKHPGHDQRIKGGVVIEVPDVNELGPKDWCDYYGVTVTRGYAILYKALDDDLSTVHARRQKIVYTPGTKAVAPDWDAVKECGNGLHASPSPALATAYNREATRYVQVKTKLADLVTLGDKIKAPVLAVVCECDIHGDPLQVAEAQAA